MEEHIGKVWDRFLSKKINNTNKNEKETVYFTEQKKSLKIFYHLLGGDKGKELQVTDKRFIKTTRTLLEKVSGSGKSFFVSWQDEKGIYLPEFLNYFPNKEHNKMHYYWLIAMMTKVTISQNNLYIQNIQATKELLKTYVGFNDFYKKCSNHLFEKNAALSFIKTLHENVLTNSQNKNDIKTAPYPLWIYSSLNNQVKLNNFKDEDKPQRDNQNTEKTETLKMRKQVNKIDDKKKTDGLLIFLPEGIMSILEQVNVDRSEDDSFNEDALYDAQDMDEISLGRKKANLSSRIKMDLDIAIESVEEYPLGKGHFLDEWDYKKEDYLENYVRIQPIILKNVLPTALQKRLKRTVKKVEQELDLMKLNRIKRNGLDYGDDININTWIDYQGHQNKTGHNQKFFEIFEKKTRDMATLILADVSLSTEAGITQETRVIDMIKDSLLVFSKALQKLEDKFAIYAFSSLKNTNVRFHIIKNFKEKFNKLIQGRIEEIKPGYYTRLGAAIRESIKILHKQKSQNKLLLIISDGKPNDVDRYDGRYGIEDTKKSILEAKQKGITPFCVTIDLEAKEYLSYLFGKNGYVVIRDTKKLPKILLKIYMNLTK